MYKVQPDMDGYGLKARHMPKSTRTEKIMYIVKHPELLGVHRVKLAEALKDAGLVSTKTSSVDLGHNRLYDEARRIIKESQ
jgi:hypothetical protein